MAGPRLVYLVDWLPPDYGAIGQYALQEAEQRAAAGEHVTLVGLSSAGSSVEERALGAGTLEIVRLASPPVDRLDFKRRALWTLKTDLRLVWRARRALLAADEVLFTASPPFLEHLLVPVAPLLRGRLTFRIADLHPECMMQELAHVPRWLHAFHAWARVMRRAADRIEVLGVCQRARLVGDGVDPARIALVPSHSPVEITPQTLPLPRPAELGGRTLLLYSGAVALAHDLDTFVEGYRRHHAAGSGRVGLWLNATGARVGELAAAIEGAGLPLHRTSGVPLADLGRLLVTADAHLITLRDAYVGLVVPSKVYGCVASGRDVLFVGSAASHVDGVCREGLAPEAYQRVSVGDAAGVARALERIADRAAARQSERRP